MTALAGRRPYLIWFSWHSTVIKFRLYRDGGGMEHKVYVIGGEDDEMVSFEQSESGRNCRLVCKVRDETHFAEEPDYFEALRTIRRRGLEPLGLIPFCYGASLKIWPSGMARDMGQGLKAYKIEIGSPAVELVGIFDSGPDIIPAKVDMQEAYAKEWLASFRKKLPKPNLANRLRNWLGSSQDR